jgi:hypothetical protein
LQQLIRTAGAELPEYKMTPANPIQSSFYGKNSMNLPVNVDDYIKAYNRFDIPGMLAELDNDIHFINIIRDEVTAETRGLAAFEDLARLGAAAFSFREQTITSAISMGKRTMAVVQYRAIVARDLPNGWTQGQEIQLSGTSYFELAGKKIRKIIDAV